MRLAVITGEKGGVGKTTVANIVASWADRIGIGWCGSDTDSVNKGFAARYQSRVSSPEIYVDGELSHEATNDMLLASIDSTRPEALRLIDVGAGHLQALAPLLGHAATVTPVTVVYVVTNWRDSLSTLAESSCLFDDQPNVNWLVVRNEVAGPLAEYDASKIRKAMQDRGAREITLRRLGNSAALAAWASMLSGNRLSTLDEFLAADDRKLFFLQGAIAGWRQAAFDQLDCVKDLFV